MCVNNLPKVDTQWNSGTTRESNPGPRVRIPSALTTRPLSHTLRVLVLVTAVQNERQPRNSAQVRQDQLEAELHHGGSSSEHGSLGCAVGPGVMSGATVSATHPAFTPVRPAHEAPAAAAAAAAAAAGASQQHRCTASNDTERRAAGRKTDPEHTERQLAGIISINISSLDTQRASGAYTHPLSGKYVGPTYYCFTTALCSACLVWIPYS